MVWFLFSPTKCCLFNLIFEYKSLYEPVMEVLPSIVPTQFSPRDLQLLCGPYSQGCFLKSQGTSHNAQHHVISLKDIRWLKTASLYFWQFLKVISGAVGKINLVPVFPFSGSREENGLLYTSFLQVHDRSINLPQVRRISYNHRRGDAAMSLSILFIFFYIPSCSLLLLMATIYGTHVEEIAYMTRK